MNPFLHKHLLKWLFTVLCVFSLGSIYSQTDLDAIMMGKRVVCSGVMFGNSNWSNYWEGTFKRDNKNLGSVNNSMVSVMTNYGISKKINLLFTLPYVTTHATAGTLKGAKGIQDLSVMLKWKAFSKKIDKSVLSLFAVGGVSLPVSDYVADYLPLAIGLHSEVASARIIADYQLNKFFVTASATYNNRSNIKIDRNSYYTTDIHLTNEVEMPDMAYFNFRTGFRNHCVVAEAVVSNMTTLGGFDIRKNDMPFPSNKMNATTAGVNLRYYVDKLPALSFTAGAGYTVAGRNVGQTTTLEGGVFYLIDFSKKTKKASSPVQALN